MKREIIKILTLEKKDFQGRKRYLFGLISFLGGMLGVLFVYFVIEYFSHSIYQIFVPFIIILLAFLAAFIT
jgi:cell division septal protein FtsQ